KTCLDSPESGSHTVDGPGQKIDQSIDDGVIEMPIPARDIDRNPAQAVDKAIDRLQIEITAPPGHNQAGADQRRTIYLIEIPLVNQKTVQGRELGNGIRRIENPGVIEKRCEENSEGNNDQSHIASQGMVMMCVGSFRCQGLFGDEAGPFLRLGQTEIGK